MGDLVERLRDGCVCHKKRWSGDTHDDLGGSVNEAATDALCMEAAAEIQRLQAEVAEREKALDHIARVALGSRKPTTRITWIIERAKSAIRGDTGWQAAKRPNGYHDALEYDAAISAGKPEAGSA